MHYHFAKVIFAAKEIFAYPEEIIFGLPGEANSRPNSRMYKEEIAADEVWLKLAQELTVAGWKNPVKFKRQFSLILRVGFHLRRKPIRQQGV